MSRVALCACAPALLGAFDFGLLVRAGPRVAADLGLTGAAYPWLFSASAFAYGAAVIPAAALTARVGPSRALAGGLLVAIGGTLALAAATAATPALAGRALFGAGGAVAATAALALATALPHEHERQSVFAALGGAVGAGFAAGTLAAGVPGWRGVLVAIALVGLLAAVVAWRLAPALRSPATAAVGPSWAAPAGAVLLTAAIAATALALARRESVVAVPVLAVAALLTWLGLRRASPWLPRPRRTLARACLAGGATTASGVSATILAGSALAAAGTPAALLAVFGLAVVPGAWLARRAARRAGHSSAAAVGLAVQALGLTALAAALVAAPAWPATAAAIVGFGVGHVAANAGVAGAVAGLAGPGAPAVGALLIAAQYLGGGLAPVLIAGSADGGAWRGVLAAAGVALVGACVIADRPPGWRVMTRSR